MVAGDGSNSGTLTVCKKQVYRTFPRTLNGARWRRGRIAADSESSERIVGSYFWPNLRRQEVHGRGWETPSSNYDAASETFRPGTLADKLPQGTMPRAASRAARA
jgi:hypothetical protein